MSCEIIHSILSFQKLEESTKESERVSGQTRAKVSALVDSSKRSSTCPNSPTVSSSHVTILLALVYSLVHSRQRHSTLNSVQSILFHLFLVTCHQLLATLVNCRRVSSTIVKLSATSPTLVNSRRLSSTLVNSRRLSSIVVNSQRISSTLVMPSEAMLGDNPLNSVRSKSQCMNKRTLKSCWRKDADSLNSRQLSGRTVVLVRPRL